MAFGFTQQCANPSEQFLQIFPDIVAQRLAARRKRPAFYRANQSVRLQNNASSEARAAIAFFPNPLGQKSARADRIELPASRALAVRLGFECLLEPPCDRRMKSEGLHGRNRETWNM
jgi:hypothetical protein